MSNETVFVGSSSESRYIAEMICTSIGIKGLRPMPWWTTFPPGNCTLTRILEVASSLDAAIFVFGNDDVLQSRGETYETTRDNVLIEWGIFVSHLGPKRCIIIAPKTVKLPTDILNLAIQPYEESIELTVQKVTALLIDEFEHGNKSSDEKGVGVLPDGNICIQQITATAPTGWLLRAFYLGLDGARAWLSVCDDHAYQANSGVRQLLSSVIRQINKADCSFKTFVSFGPGDGSLDIDVIGALKRKEQDIGYIPVDISAGLLLYVYDKLKSKVYIPAALLADFEGRFEFVAAKVKKHGKSPTLYALLGGTFGNLDMSENKFLTALVNTITPEDRIFFDVAINKTSFDGPPSPPSVHEITGGRKIFYAHGASKMLNVPMQEVLEHFDEYVSTETQDEPSAIPGTTVFVFNACKLNEKKPFAYARRYSRDQLEKWLKEEIQVDATIEDFPSTGKYGRALIVLKRRERF